MLAGGNAPKVRVIFRIVTWTNHTQLLESSPKSFMRKGKGKRNKASVTVSFTCLPTQCRQPSESSSKASSLKGPPSPSCYTSLSSRREGQSPPQIPEQVGSLLSAPRVCCGHPIIASEFVQCQTLGEPVSFPKRLWGAEGWHPGLTHLCSCSESQHFAGPEQCPRDFPRWNCPPALFLTRVWRDP